MKKFICLFASILLTLTLIIPETANAYNTAPYNESKCININNDTGSDFKSNVVIVKFKSNTYSNNQILNIYPYSNYFTKIVRNIHNDGILLLQLKNGLSPQSVVSVLSTDKSIDFIQPDYEYKVQSLSSDAYSSYQWGLENNGQRIDSQYGTSGIDINVKKAWGVTKGSSSVVVGVIDTGVDTNQEDLKNNIWINTKEIPGNGIDDDNNGYVDDVNGWNFNDNNNSVYDSVNQGDSYSHGTHVSGIIAASQNNTGVVGVAPGVKIMPLKCGSNDGNISDDAIIRAILYAQKMGVKIINCSWGKYSLDPAMKYVMQESNILFVCAAGNDTSNNDFCPFYPASFDLPNIISVAAIDNQANLANFSDYGENTVDVAAPGVGILSTVPLQIGQTGADDTYQDLDGTSMAAPFVTGIAALLLSDGITDPVTIKDRIISSCKPISDLTGKVKSGGIVDAYNALTYNQESEIPGNPLNNDNKGFLKQGANQVFYVDLSAGETLNLTLSGENSVNFHADIYKYGSFTVKNQNGIVSSTSTGNGKISYTSDVTGRYYINVAAKNDLGNFDLITSTDTAKSEIMIDDSNNSIAYSGRWASDNNVQCENGTVRTLGSQGEASYSFTGSDIKWEGFKSSNQGIAKVYIDGNFDSEVNLYSPTTLYKQILYEKKLNYGKHQVQIKWAGKNSSGKKQDNKINIDALVASTVYELPVPTNFHLSSNNLESIFVQFDSVYDTQVKNYVIYRSTDNVQFNCIATLPVYNGSIMLFNDTDVSSGTYYYKVASVDSVGKMSAFSNSEKISGVIANHVHMIDDTDPSVKYYGNWTTNTDSRANGGSYHTTSDKGAKVVIPFTGYAYMLQAILPCNGVVKITDPTGASETIDLSKQTDWFIAQENFNTKRISGNLELECVSGTINFDYLRITDTQ